MKKWIAMVFMAIMLTACVSSETPFFGAFVDDTPNDLSEIHNSVYGAMKAVPGTTRWELTYLDDGRIAGCINESGFKGWCSNYAVAVRAELIKAGYEPEQIKYVHCSIFDTEKPDHVVVTLDDTWVFDAAQDFVMRLGEYPDKWVNGVPPYIWWIQTEGKWVRTKL